jgi:hypothetical protein
MPARFTIAPLGWRSTSVQAGGPGRWHPAIRRGSKVLCWPNITLESRAEARICAAQSLADVLRAADAVCSDWDIVELWHPQYIEETMMSKMRKPSVMVWEDPVISAIDDNASYVVFDNGGDWADPDLHVFRAIE